jgi:hypothetical protein
LGTVRRPFVLADAAVARTLVARTLVDRTLVARTLVARSRARVLTASGTVGALRLRRRLGRCECLRVAVGVRQDPVDQVGLLQALVTLDPEVGRDLV